MLSVFLLIKYVATKSYSSASKEANESIINKLFDAPNINADPGHIFRQPWMSDPNTFRVPYEAGDMFLDPFTLGVPVTVTDGRFYNVSPVIDQKARAIKSANANSKSSLGSTLIADNKTSLNYFLKANDTISVHNTILSEASTKANRATGTKEQV